MSSPARGRGGGARGRGRGGSRSANNSDDESARQSTRRTRANNTAKTPSSTGLGRGVGRGLQGALGQVRTPAAPRRGNQSTRGNTAQSNGPSQGGFGVSTSRSTNKIAPSVAERLKVLRKARENERQNAIAQGFLADPDRPRTLAEAVTPVGTCQDMCPEYERLQRIQQNDVWGPEYDPETVSLPRGKQVPEELRMVKKFKRSAAGTDEQLPSDLRPPVVLQRTCDYLFNQLLNETQDLKPVHHFIWDRTRAIRNDFSIQQLTKIPDIRIATDCYERIARFHILSLHLVGGISERADRYDWFQDREQLDRTLLSLINYYDNARNHYRSPNEAEFRAYCVIFQIPNPTADLEDRVQTWPPEVTCDPRVQKALKLYYAAQNITIPQGPLKERIGHPIAQSNWSRFWKLTASEETSYLMSCVAEINFNRVRRNALQSIWRSFRQGGNTKSEDWSLEELVDALGFDEEKQVQTFVESYQFRVIEKDGGKQYLDLNSVPGKIFPDPIERIPDQQFSDSIVEVKRCGRTLSALVNGLSTKAAIQEGMIMDNQGPQAWESHAVDRKELSLFVSSDSEDEDELRVVGGPSASMGTIGRITMEKTTSPRRSFASALTRTSIPATTIESSTISKATGNSINTVQSPLPAASDPTFSFTVTPPTPPTQSTQTPISTPHPLQSFTTVASGTPPVTLSTSAPSIGTIKYPMANEQGAPAPNQGNKKQQPPVSPEQSNMRSRKGISIFHRMTKLAFALTGTNPRQHHHPVPQQQQAAMQQQRPLPDFQSHLQQIQQGLMQQQQDLHQQQPPPQLPQQIPPGQLLPSQASKSPKQQQPLLPHQMPLPESPPQQEALLPQQISLPESPPQQQANVSSDHSVPRSGKRKITDRIEHSIAAEAQSQHNATGPSGKFDDHRAKRPILNLPKKSSSVPASNPPPQQPQSVLQHQQPQWVLQQPQSVLQSPQSVLQQQSQSVLQQQPQSVLQQQPQSVLQQQPQSVLQQQPQSVLQQQPQSVLQQQPQSVLQQQPQSVLQQQHPQSVLQQPQPNLQQQFFQQHPPGSHQPQLHPQQQFFPHQQQAAPQQPQSILQQPQSTLQQQPFFQQSVDVHFENAEENLPSALPQRPPRSLVFAHLGAPGSAEWQSKYEIRPDNIFGYLVTPAAQQQDPPTQHATYLQAGGYPPQQQPMLHPDYPQDAVWNLQQQASQSQPGPTLTPYEQYQAAILYAQMVSAEKAREDAEAERASREKYHREWMERYTAEKAAAEKVAAEKEAAEKEWREQRLAEERQEKMRLEKRALERQAAFKIAEPIRKDEVHEYLARQMTLDLSWGVLPTYIYHVTRQLVTQEMLNFEDEQDRRQADEFRQHALAVRYWHRWYRNVRSMRLRRRGQLYRARAKDIMKQKSQTPDAKEVDLQEVNKAIETSTKRAEANYIVDSLIQKQTYSSPNKHHISTNSQPSEHSPRHHETKRESSLQSRGTQAHPSTEVARRSKADDRISQTTGAASPAHSTIPSALSAPDATGIPVIDLIRSNPRPDAKISTFKNPYYLFKSHGISVASQQSFQREAAKRKRTTEYEPNQTDRTSHEPNSPPENKKRASEAQMQHFRSLSNESHNGIQQVLQEFEESESWYRQARDELQRVQGLEGTVSGSTTSSNVGVGAGGHQLGPARPQSVPKYRSRQSKFVSRELFGGLMAGGATATTRSSDVTTMSRQEDEEQMQQQEAEAAVALLAASRARNANSNGYSHSNRFAALAQDEDTEIDDDGEEEESEEIYEEYNREVTEAAEKEQEIEDETDEDDDDDDDVIEIVATKLNHGTGTGVSADDAIELDSD